MDMMLEQFKTIFDRPEKVKRLRETILDLAVRGKLVKQDPNDEPASVLLERIKEEKERLVKEGKIKREKPLPEIREDEKPYELPRGWEWVRLEYCTQFINGYAFKSNTYVTEGNNQIIRLGNVKNEGLILEKKDIYIPDNIANECENYMIIEDDILVTMTGTRNKRDYFFTYKVRKSDLVRKKLFLNQRVGLIRGYIPKQNYFFNVVLKSNYILNKIFESETGTANQGNIGVRAINELVIPMSPLNEQKRIVEKVDSLMTFCDKLEKALEKKVHYGELSAKSIFNAVGSVSTVKELEETLRFILLNFKDLSLGDNAVKELKNCILQLAVQGKLVPQDPDDESAEVLLEKITEEKERLIKEGKIKREKPLGEIREEEKPFELPDGWKYCRMNDIVDVRDGTHDSPKYISEGGFPLVTGKDFYGGKLNFSKTKYISKEDYEKIITRSKVDVGDILYSMIGGNIGSMILIEDQLDIAIKNVALFKRYIKDSFEPKYLMFYLKANLKNMKSLSKGGAQPFISLLILRNYLFTLPPLNEQRRIVEKANSLMSLCDELEKKIEKMKSYSNRLMESILKDSFKA
jgi:type I restriction enzyme S subunit